MSPTAVSGNPRVIVLTGMMGTGKTAVGRELAARLDVDFVDTDTIVEAREGKAIAEVVAERGEPVFRQLERLAVESLVGSSNCVIATGGWTMADPDSRAILEALGPVICLTATADVLSARLHADEPDSRPTLAGNTGPHRLRQLLSARRTVYDSLPMHTDTARRTPGEVADEALALVASMPVSGVAALPVSTPTGGYSVLVGSGLLDALGAQLSARGLGGRVALVSDPTVGSLYGSRIASALEETGLMVVRAEIPEGETSKNLATVSGLYETLLDGGLDRHSAVVALGGGVVGDTAGFAAATFMRGVALVHVPTTLLAMVDAAIGGKTGVNLPAGKNLVGAFHHPSLVLADPIVLGTLEPTRLREGLAEVVKAALIADPALLGDLERDGAPEGDDANRWAAVVARAAAVKTAIVSADPHERGRRAVLNLGHTFAHALEHTTAYSLSHGEAVAIGLVAAARLAVKLQLADAGLPERIEKLLGSLNLPTLYHGPSPTDVYSAMQPDKKRADGRLRFVLPLAPGDVTVVDDVPRDEVLGTIESLRANGPVDASPGGL